MNLESELVAELLSPEDPRWGAALERVPHDIYHLPSYVRFAAAHEGGRATALYAEEGGELLLAPVVLREVPAELGGSAGEVDAISPYGYSGPVTTAAPGSGKLGRLLVAAAHAAAEAGVVCGFFRMHPLLPLDEAVLAERGEIVRHGQTVHVRLGDGAEAARAGIRQGHRHDIKKLERAGFRAEVNRWEDFERFVDIYLETMRRIAADQYYLFSQAYFRQLRAALGEELNLISVRTAEGEVAAGGLFSTHGGIAQYLFSGTAEAYLRQAPTKLMLATAIEWAAERGGDVLHLGGGVGGAEDSLFRFKAGFSKRRSDFTSYRIVFDGAAYESLVAAWAHETGGTSESTFFPVYRKPVGRNNTEVDAPPASE